MAGLFVPTKNFCLSCKNSEKETTEIFDNGKTSLFLHYETSNDIKLVLNNINLHKWYRNFLKCGCI